MESAHYSLLPWIPQVLYGHLQLMKKTGHRHIFEMCMLVSIYLKFYSDCIKSREESPDVEYPAQIQ